MIPHIENGEACIIVAINSEARAKAAKIMGTVSLGNKAIKGVAKVREAMQANNQSQGKMERRSDNKNTREKIEKRANARQLRTESTIAKVEDRKARNLPKSATPRGVKEKALFLKKSGGDTLEARKMVLAKFETRNAFANKATAAKKAGRGEPPKMNMATSIASGKQRLSDKRKASDAAETAAGFIPSKTFGGKQSNVRRADRRLKVQEVRDRGLMATRRSKEKKADLAAVAAKEAIATAKRPARQAAAQKGLATKAANKAAAANKANAASNSFNAASGKQRLSAKRKASDAAETAAGFIPSKTFGGKQSNVRRADRRLKVQEVRDRGLMATRRSKEKKADLAAVAAKEAIATAKRPARQAAAQKGLATKAANKAKGTAAAAARARARAAEIN